MPLPPSSLLSLLAAFGALVLASCSFPRVDPEHPARFVRVEEAPPRTSLWPARKPPTAPPLKVKEGFSPVDEGTYQNCRVVRAAGLKHGTALLISGLRPQAVKEEEPFTLMIDGPEADSEIEIKTHLHRVSLTLLKPARTREARGLVIYLASIMLISPEERKFINTLTKRGWNVAAITPALDLFAKDRWPTRLKEEELPKHAALLAREIDDHLAESAYAAESLLGWLRKDSPSWLDGPRVVIGASAGSLALPAVVKRTGKPDAVVLVGGGVNVPEILLESTLDIYQPEIELSNRDTLSWSQVRNQRKELESRLKQLALRESRLDPLHHLSSLRSVPTLMLSAERDRIMPAHTGELLYEALRRPERWSYPTGHIVLFLSLPFQANRVADWMERNTRS